MSEPLLQAIAAQDDRCPRCGGGFHCGVNDAAPCPCASVTLAAATQAALRERYSTCLCLRCLQAVRDAAVISPH
ncbi:MAG: cysteine-rich CWC family protein [Microbacteriaceae bacterium]|nr:cysteine-rich CWC family protein [Burkholderiaceae bacterium]